MNKETPHQGDQILVSVGIPTYNRPEGLRRTLVCITNQSYENLEIIVSDNCSEGPVQSVVEEFAASDKRILFFRQARNVGMIANFKFVLEKSTGQYFMWASDDDEWHEDFIKTCVDNVGECGSIMTGVCTVNRHNKKTWTNPVPELGPENSAFENARRFLCDMQPSLVCGLHRRNTIIDILAVRGFDFYDCFFILKQILRHGFKVHKEVMYFAGIDEGEYAPKPVTHSHSALFNYQPFFWSTGYMILVSKKLKFLEKMSLMYNLVNTVSSLFIHHEHNHRPNQVIAISIIRKVIACISSFVASVQSHIVGTGMTIGCFANRRLAPLRRYAETVLAILAVRQFRSIFKASFSQSGEDLIVRFIFDALGIEKPSYIDVGAHHPYYLSNTALFYLMGSRGINIEPDPRLYEQFVRARSEDINLNIGLSKISQDATLYEMSTPTLNTFSKATADDLVKQGKVAIISSNTVKLDTISNVLDKYSRGLFPDFLSLDAEGMELEILSSIDYGRNKPAVICVESISYSESGKGMKDQSVSQFLADKGYMLYADTHINTIFVENSKWVRI